MTLSLVALAVAGSAQAAGNVEAGKAKSAMCVACHGADGNSAAPNFPKLAGQHASYIAKQLADFKSGARVDPVMVGMVATLTPEEMANLGAYFASQTNNGGTAAADKVAAGQALYRGGNKASGVPACSGCHGPTGTGNEAARFPSIAGQHAAYVEKALKDFRSGTRTNDMNGMMGGVAKHLTDDEIAAVAQYVQGLK